MKPREILNKIIDNNGSCDWVTYNTNECKNCPIGGHRSCTTVVKKLTGSNKDKDYLVVAKKLLADMDVEKIILGDDIEV